MAVTETPRLKLPHWGAGTDPHPGRTGWNTILDKIDDSAALAFPSGTIANRPASGAFGRFFLATDQGDTGRLYYDGGTGWVELNTNGGGGAGNVISVNVSGVEGTSNRSARADHTHRLPLATPTTHGAMASQWAEAMESIAVPANPGSLVKRTMSGNVVVPGIPGGPNDAASKSYVDSQGADGVTEATPNSLMKRGSAGTVHVKTGTFADDATNIAWVNNRIGNHTHSADDVTSGQFHRDRIRYSSWAYNTAWGGVNSIRSVHVTNGGELCFYSSTERHKTNIVPWGVDPRDVFAVIPIEFDRLDPVTGEPTGVHDYGVRAEQAGQHLPMYLQHDEQGRIDGWSYEQWPAALQVGLRDLDSRDHAKDEKIAAQGHEIVALRAENTKLRDRLGAIEHHLGLTNEEG